MRPRCGPPWNDGRTSWPDEAGSPRLVGALGALLVVVGAVVFAVVAGSPDVVTYDGSYPPLEQVDSAYESSVMLSLDDGLLLTWTAAQALGPGLGVLGLHLLATLGGWLLGRSSRRD